MKEIKAAIKQLEGLSFLEVQTLLVVAALERSGGNKTVMAEELGVSLKTVYNYLNQALLDKQLVELVNRFLEAEPCSPPKVLESFRIARRRSTKNPAHLPPPTEQADGV